MSLAVIVVGTMVIAATALLIHRDASRVGVDIGTPTMWALFVAATAGAGLLTAVIVPDAPLPGVLVLAALGPLLYVLERDDSIHGDDPADPTRLPSAGADDADERAAENEKQSDSDTW